MSIRRHLIHLIIATLLPTFLLAGSLSLIELRDELLGTERLAENVAKNIALAMDRQLLVTLAAMEILADSPSLREAGGNHRRFQEEAAAFQRHQGGLLNLVDRSGAVIDSGPSRFGEALPPAIASALLHRVVNTGKPAFSDAFPHTTTHMPQVALMVPVSGPDGVLFGLTLCIDTDDMNELLAKSAPPWGWRAGILDAKGYFIGRSDRRDRDIIVPASSELTEALRAAETGRVATIARDGTPVTAFFLHSDVAPWAVVVGIDNTTMAEPGIRRAVVMGTAALAALLVTAWIATRAARRLSRAISGLAAGRLEESGLDEVDQVARQLMAAQSARDSLAVDLRAAKDTAEEILESIADGFYSLANDWRFRYVNRPAERLLGRSREELMGKTVFEAFPMASGGEVVRQLAQVLADQQPRAFEAFSSVFQKWTSFSVYPAAGGLSVFFRDISAKRATEEELMAARDKAERANIAKSRFLAAASHDLRQPYQAMSLYKDILDARLTDPTDRKVLDALGTAMTAGQDLLNALLHVSTLEAGITVPKPRAVPLDAILPNLAAEFSEQASGRGLKLKVYRTRAVIFTDPVLFARMVRNLLSNAMKYTDAGGVLMGVRNDGDDIRVEIWDSGPGIPEDRQNEIWEEFTQLHNPERDRSHGLGLGLAIVARTGRLLGHPVGLRSRPGKGSVFFITAPRAAAPPA